MLRIANHKTRCPGFLCRKLLTLFRPALKCALAVSITAEQGILSGIKSGLLSEGRSLPPALYSELPIPLR